MHNDTPFLSWLVPAAALFTGCGLSTTPERQSINIPECNTYVARLETCLTRLGPQAKAAAEDDANAARKALAAAVTDDSSRAQIKNACIAGLDRLAVTCR
jgi:hypothetical protein